MTTAAPPRDDDDAALARAVDAALGAALGDREVVEVGAVEGGLIEVVRSGRRERLPVLAQGELFSLLRDRGAEVDAVHARLPGGARLVAAPLVDGRVAVAVQRPIAEQARFESLSADGVLPPGVDGELVSAVLEGRGVVVVGPSRSGRARLAAATARAVAATVRCVALGDDVPAGCQPPPGIPHLVARARTAVALGADVVVALELSVREAADLAANTPGVPVIASVAAPTVDVVAAAVGEKAFAALAPVVAVVAFAPDGRPRLLELHGGAAQDETQGAAPNSSRDAARHAPPSMGPSPPGPWAAPPPPPPLARPRTHPGLPVVIPTASGDAPVALGEAPPADWASADAEDDPGWELGSLARDGSDVSTGSFDAALAAAAKRPTFSPRAPTAHPAVHALRGTGGLTFEPPNGPGSDDDGER